MGRPGGQAGAFLSSLPVRPRPRTRVATSRSGCSHRFTGRLFPCKVCRSMSVPWHLLTDVYACQLCHKYAVVMQAGLAPSHRTGRHPLIIHLAPKASTDQLSSRPATQNRTKAARRQSTHCQCPCNVPLCPSREHLHNTASARSSHHGSMSNETGHACQCAMPAPRRVATCRRGRFARARPRTPSPAARPVSIAPAAS